MAKLQNHKINATLLLNDDFDNENYQTGDYNYQSLKNWNIVDGSVDLIGKGFFDYFPENGLYLDMDGSTKNGGKIETKQTFDLMPGSLILKFDLAGSQRELEETDKEPNTVNVAIGNLYSENFTMGGMVPLQSVYRNIIIHEPSSVKLSLDQSGEDERGLILDNVELYYHPTNTNDTAGTP